MFSPHDVLQVAFTVPAGKSGSVVTGLAIKSDNEDFIQISLNDAGDAVGESSGLAHAWTRLSANIHC